MVKQSSELIRQYDIASFSVLLTDTISKYGFVQDNQNLLKEKVIILEEETSPRTNV